MADIKEFQIGSNVYQFKDESARNSISALQAAVGSPLVANLTADMTNQNKIYVYTGSETGYTAGHWYYYDGSDWTDGGTYQSHGIGAGTVNGQKLSDDLKEALLTIFEHVAFIDANGKTYYDELESVLYSGAVLLSINAVFNQGQNVIYDNSSLDDLKQYLTVTAYYDDNTTRTISNYTLTGTLSEGTSIITVTYHDKTTTFNVNITSYTNRMYYALSDGDLSLVTGAVSSDTTYGLVLDNNANRRSFFIGTGIHKVKYKVNTAYSDTEYYPIPVPQNATKWTVSITPTTQYLAIKGANYNAETDKYSWDYDSGWVQNSSTNEFEAGAYEFIFVTSKYNSSGNTYPTQPTELTILFE